MKKHQAAELGAGEEVYLASEVDAKLEAARGMANSLAHALEIISRLETDGDKVARAAAKLAKSALAAWRDAAESAEDTK